MPYMIAVSLEMSDEPYLKIKYYLCESAVGFLIQKLKINKCK